MSQSVVFVGYKKWRVVREACDRVVQAARRNEVRPLTVWEGHDYHKAAIAIRDATYCVVWHGHSPWTTWAKMLRRRLGKHCKTMEVGWFPQDKTYQIEGAGLCGDSVLCGDIPEQDTSAYEQVRETFERRLNQEPIVPMFPGTVLVPLQLPSDVAMYEFSPYKLTTHFVAHVLEKFPDRPIAFKTHPKQRGNKIDVQGRDDVAVYRDGWFPALARSSDLVYGQTSTALYEAALLGFNVECIGDTPLRYHTAPEERRQLLAAMCNMQFPRTVPDDELWRRIVEG